MKVLIINGSPRKDGNSQILIDGIKKVFDKFGVGYTEVNVANKDVRGCMACGYCKENKKCVFNDVVNETSPLFKEADGLIVVSPTYFGSPNGSVISFLDRLFYSADCDRRMKVGAAFAVARRGGTTATFDVLNKYFTISGMPIASGDYWNNGFGREKGDIIEDKEGLRNARVVAGRMVFLMRAIADAKQKYPEFSEEEPRVSTHFVKKS
ncbi:MAG: flavodoxin family protein [Clostridia bacterium]|nr:flavodoxin family protein [Clostridia bacterium]